MRTIHKYPISIGNLVNIDLQEDWKFLHFDVQGAQPTFWVEVETDEMKSMRTFIVVGTGWNLDEIELEEDEYLVHLGTAQNGSWVWHLYEIFRADW